MRLPGRYRCLAPLISRQLTSAYSRQLSSVTDAGYTGSSLRTLSKAVLIGRLGAAPVLRTFDDGRQSLQLSVATNQWVMVNDSREERTQWHRVFVNQNATGFDFIRTLPQGTLVYVEGDLRTVSVNNFEGRMQYVNIHVSAREGTVRAIGGRTMERENLNEVDNEALSSNDAADGSDESSEERARLREKHLEPF